MNMKKVRYSGEFLSRKGVRWKVEILQEGFSGSTGELTFEGEEPLVIDWQRTDKEEVVCGSEATLRIESPGDRTYEDLYSIAVGEIRMDVYREGLLYWSGALDPEFYEEPYERSSMYAVALTFSDFGILDRLKFGYGGMVTIERVVLRALERSTIKYTGLDTSMCSTYFEDGSKVGLSGLSVRAGNFYDEDGEACSYKEVLEGVLQPLGMKIVQRCGKIWVFDLNGLSGSTARRLVWDGDSQTMGVDKVANNVRISFSPYSSAELLSGEVRYSGKYGSEYVNLTSSSGDCEEGMEYYSYYPNYGDVRQGSNVDYSLVNFTLFLSSEGFGLDYLSGLARYCHVQPMVSGPSEDTCVAWSFMTGGHGALSTGWPVQKLNAVSKGSDTVVMRSSRVFLPRLGASDRSKYYLRLTLDMLLDARYNPFSEAKDNEEENYNKMKGCTAWAFVPVGVTLYDMDGNAVCHFCNRPKTVSGTQGNMYWSMIDSVSVAGQEPAISWKSGEAVFGDCWLAYYDPNDLMESAGILGWHKNRQNIGRPDVAARQGGSTDGYVDYSKGYFAGWDYGKFYMYGSFKSQPDGEYIPYPADGGYLEVTVYEGVRCFDYGESGDFETTAKWDAEGLYGKVRWLLYKSPCVEVVRKNLVFDEAELDDVEYSGYLNKDAREEISIDTICGTADGACPTAKGIYVRSSDGLQIQRLVRNGVTDHPENLLIGTLYSQYAARHTTLEGEAVLDSGGLCVYEEENQAGKVFMVLEEQQDVLGDSAEVVVAEVSGDEYEGVRVNL